MWKPFTKYVREEVKVYIPKYIFIETPDPKPLPQLTQDLKESLRTLKSFPAFDYLLQRLAQEKALSKHQLETNFQLSEQQKIYLQCMCYAFNKLSQTVDQLTSTPAPQQVPASEEMLTEFERINAELELVGG